MQLRFHVSKPQHPWLSLFCLTALALAPSSLRAQGCVIARGGGGACAVGGEILQQPGSWQITAAHRYFRSHRHFIGFDEQTIRYDNGTEVINHSHFLDVTISYAKTDRLSYNLTLPFVDHDRSSLYEHLGNTSGQRFHTQSSGLADMRAGVSYWVLDPKQPHRGNFSLGIGLKAPTGDYKATDTFIRSTGPTVRYVDSSIQPGDGGWGFAVEAQGFLRLGAGFSGYAAGFYLFNPKEKIAATGFSVPDAYMLRSGVDYMVSGVHGLTFSLGGRWEGIPPEDAIGKSRGSRRPGYAMSVEPGVNYTKGRFTVNFALPVAVVRNRQMTKGATRKGDAAFADYTFNTSLSYRL